MEPARFGRWKHPGRRGEAPEIVLQFYYENSMKQGGKGLPGGSLPSIRRLRNPFGGQPDRFSLGHLDEGKALPRGDKEGIIAFPADFEGAPEPGALEAVEPTMDQQSVTEGGGTFVVDLGPDDDGVKLGIRHSLEIHTHEPGEAGPAGFDHAQIRQIVNHTSDVGVEEHHFLTAGVAERLHAEKEIGERRSEKLQSVGQTSQFRLANCRRERIQSRRCLRSSVV